MRVLAVIETDLIEKGPHQTHHLLERLSLRGHQIRLIDYEISWKKKKHESLVSKKVTLSTFSKAKNNSRVTLIRPRIIYLPLLDYVSEPFTYGEEIYKQIKTFKPDIIIGFSILNTYLALKLSKIYSIPFVYYLIDAQHTQIPESFLRIIGKYVESQIARNSDKVLVINEELGTYASRLGADPKKIQVIRAGIDPSRFNPNTNGDEIRRKYGIEKDEIILFFMGWLYPFSGIKEVASSLIEYSGNCKIRLLVLGTGDLYEFLLKLKSKDLHNRIILVDWQPYEKVPGFVAASDICLLPAYINEVMKHIVPIKMYEYMACGKPVIATRLPGIIREFGDGNGVVYVDGPQNVLKEVVELAKDKDRILSIGAKAARYVQGYSWERLTDEFEMTLDDLVGKKQRTVDVNLQIGFRNLDRDLHLWMTFNSKTNLVINCFSCG